MYHDQGLPVLKYASFGRGVNVTLGLPFMRTSVDHGTALDLAGTGRADAGSLDRGAASLPSSSHQCRVSGSGSISCTTRACWRASSTRSRRARTTSGGDRPRRGRPDRAACSKRRRTRSDRDRPRSRRAPARGPERRRCTQADALEFDFAPVSAPACAWSATCRTTSRRRCCSISRASPSACATCTSCCSSRWWSAWWPRPPRRRTAGCRWRCRGAFA